MFLIIHILSQGKMFKFKEITKEQSHKKQITNSFDL